MKSILRKTIFFMSVIGIVLTLSACDIDLSPYTTGSEESEVETVDVRTGTMQNAYVTDDLDLSTITLEVTFDDDSVEYVPLESTYLNGDSLDALESEGTKTLEGTYEGESFSFDITLVTDSRALLLHTIHTLGVADTSLEEDYETWLSSIEGTSVTDAYFNESNELVFTLSDDTTINVGSVPLNDAGLPETLIESAHLENNQTLVFTYTDGSEETIDLDFAIYTIQFKTPEGTVFDVQTLKEGAQINYPEAPDIEGYAFTGFASEPTEATEDTVIQALYDPLSITLTFDTLNGNTFTRTKAYESPIDFPDPSRSGFEFMGWFEDADFNTPFASSTMPSEDMTLYAKWIDLSTGETVDGSTDPVVMLETIESAIVGVNNINSTESGTGSGVVYKDNGDGSYNMITNHHVIENYETLEIVYEYYNNYYIVPDSNITVLGSYPETDIAVITFTPTHSVNTVPIADSYTVNSGERVYALGSPQGQNYIGSITEGIVASPMRYMNTDGTDAFFIQHDAAISPGNSGGALVNSEGELIGMNTLKLTGENVEGMGFALTSNTISRMIEDIEDDGVVTRATLGVSMNDATQCAAEYGACIDSVTLGSTADALGLESGDTITAYKTASMSGFREIYNQNYLYEAVQNTLPGTEITIEYERSGVAYTSTAIITE